MVYTFYAFGVLQIGTSFIELAPVFASVVLTGAQTTLSLLCAFLLWGTRIRFRELNCLMR